MGGKNRQDGWNKSTFVVGIRYAVL